MLACHFYCVEYFSNGHTPFHVRLIRSNSPTLNALVWGCYATWILGVLCGVVLSYVSRNQALAKPIDVWVMAICAGAIAFVTLVYGEVCARRAMKQYPKSAGGWGPERDSQAQYLSNFFSETISAESGCEDVDLSLVPELSRPGWLATGERNGAGYTIMPGLAIALAVVVFLTRCVYTVVDKWNENCDSMWGAMCGSDYPVPGVMWTLYFVIAPAGLVGFIVFVVVMLSEMNGMGRRGYDEGGKAVRVDPDEHIWRLKHQIREMEDELSGAELSGIAHYGATDESYREEKEELKRLRQELREAQADMGVFDEKDVEKNVVIKSKEQPEQLTDTTDALDLAFNPGALLRRGSKLFQQQNKQRMFKQAVNQSVAGAMMVEWMAHHRNTVCAQVFNCCLLYTSPSPRDRTRSRMPSSA
eukprot:TRINITY_DN13213_c0_g1_i1.p1 TRINITY_DN13213_c0_g1~~TRINITY_DN13213_c0_g1_i1.p1  ORF type:complete len:415 (+),score=108.52 TRINITY_DN13213_c0_g1_i1:205-1449(+)